MTIDQVTEPQAGKEALINELFDGVLPFFTLMIHRSACVGLTLAVYGGNFKGTVIASQTVALPASATRFIEADATTGALYATAGAYTTGRVKLGVAVTSGTGLISYVPADRQAWPTA